MTPTQMMLDIANPRYGNSPKAGRFLMLSVACGSRAQAIRYAVAWVRRHKGAGRSGLRIAIKLTSPRREAGAA